MKLLHILPLFLLLCSPTLAATPQETARSINAAVAEGDVNTFQQLVDMDAILTDALQTFLSEMTNPQSGTQLPPVLALMLSGAVNQENVRQLLLGESKAFVLNGIASGAFAGKSLAPTQQQGILAPLFANASLGRKEIAWTGDAVRDGDGWILPFVVHDYGNGRDYSVTARFQASGDTPLRLVGITNLQELFAKIRQEMKENP